MPASTATVVNSQDFSSLGIKDASSDHSGNYTCVVSNAYGSESFTARLSVRCESLA